MKVPRQAQAAGALACLPRARAHLQPRTLVSSRTAATTTVSISYNALRRASSFSTTSSTTPVDKPKAPKAKAKAKAKTALFFPGQGTQRVGMLSPWASAFPSLTAQFFDETDSILNFPLSTMIQSGPSRTLTSTPNAQPAIFATSILILRILESHFSFRPASTIDVVLGHSLGEFAALVAAGNLSYPDALRLLRERAEVMAAATSQAGDPFPDHAGLPPPPRRSVYEDDNDEGEPEPVYGMVALVCEPDHLSSLVEAIKSFLRDNTSSDGHKGKEISLANENSKNQIVLSGYLRHISELLSHLRNFAGHDPRAVRLSADSPFHSQLMAPAAAAVRARLDSGTCPVRWPGAIACISNVSARPFASEANLKDLLARSCVETVKWWASIRYLDAEVGVRRWVGLGPGKVGRNLVGKEVGFRKEGVAAARGREGRGVWGVEDPRDVEGMLRGLEETEGEELD